ncbi:MAG: hypothetical protein IKP86_13355 [Anaerolineaceae bacterium]|nr:hypothetical protein [Anaerolineaceae bacterium]
MTAQISDSFTYKKKFYELVAQSGDRELFCPEEFGFHPSPLETCCWAGYWCEFEISDAIYLQRLAVHCDAGNYPAICGRSAGMPSKGWYEQSHVAHSYRPDNTGYQFYERLNLKIPYTGKILVGSGFIEKFLINMGFQRAYAYKKLVEFELEDGFVKSTADLSRRAEEYRKMIGKADPIEFEDRSNIPQYIDRCFSLSYKDKTWWNN